MQTTYKTFTLLLTQCQSFTFTTTYYLHIYNCFYVTFTFYEMGIGASTLLLLIQLEQKQCFYIMINNLGIWLNSVFLVCYFSLPRDFS